jgi:hypothetical protein
LRRLEKLSLKSIHKGTMPGRQRAPDERHRFSARDLAQYGFDARGWGRLDQKRN